MTTRKEQAARSKANLIAIGKRLFTEQGYDATSVRQILDEADMARGALYHHFPDGKLDLFLAVVDDIDAVFHDGLETILAGVESPTEQILAGMGLLLDLATDKHFGRVILIEANNVVPGMWVTGSEFQLLRDAIDRAIEAGEWSPVPLDTTAAVLYGAARRAADYVAGAKKPKAAARDALISLTALVDGMRA